MKILAIGAHPDDIEIGCSGTLLFLKEAYDAQIYTLVMTRGEKFKGFHSVEERDIEQQEALRVLGVHKHFSANLPDTDINLKDAILNIESIVNTVNPTCIFTHFEEDTHQDHRVIAQATDAACRKNISSLYYESISTKAFQPTIFVDIGNMLRTKCQAIAMHKSQEKKLQLVDYVRTLAKYRAYRTGLEYVEGFVPRKFIWR